MTLDPGFSERLGAARVSNRVETHEQRSARLTDGASTLDQLEVPVSLEGSSGESYARRVDGQGVRPLRDARDAFAMRVALIRSATRTLDVQYYIWHDDLSGTLLLAEIEAAADRGVRVRLLLDDNGIAGMDARLRAMCRRANIKVRLYNPFPIRFPKAINWFFVPRRLNHRMHAKSLTADRRLTIVGGRNVGDEYFGAKSEGLFDDLDVLAAGPAVDGVLRAFDQHWQSHLARPAEIVLKGVSRAAIERSLEGAGKMAASSASGRYLDAIRHLPLAYDIRDGDLNLISAEACAVAVFPDQNCSPVNQCSLAQLLPQGLGTPAKELIIISGYFVPTLQGSAELMALARSGVTVRVLTNSYAATDVGPVHAGYAPRRKALLQAGVELAEMPAPDDKPKSARKFLRGGSTAAREHSGRSLHSKSYIVDRKRLYIGSANFDPRSVALNTELGLAIDSTALAEEMAQAFGDAARKSYRLSLGEQDQLCWTDLRDDRPQCVNVEPGTTIMTRLLVHLLARLPIERFL